MTITTKIYWVTCVYQPFPCIISQLSLIFIFAPVARDCYVDIDFWSLFMHSVFDLFSSKAQGQMHSLSTGRMKELLLYGTWLWYHNEFLYKFELRIIHNIIRTVNVCRWFILTCQHVPDYPAQCMSNSFA